MFFISQIFLPRRGFDEPPNTAHVVRLRSALACARLDRARVGNLGLLIALLALTLVVTATLAIAQGPTGTKPRAPRAALGTAFTYQGQLKRSGSAYTGACDMQFALYDAASNGTQIGTTQSVSGVTVTNRLFTTPIDFGASAFDGNKRFLQIAVKCGSDASYTTLTSLQELTATPYARFSANTPWSGLSGVPNPVTFLVNPSSCSNGQVATWNGTTWTCAAATSYSAGNGLALVGNVFSVDENVVATQVWVRGALHFDDGIVNTANVPGTVVRRDDFGGEALQQALSRRT